MAIIGIQMATTTAMEIKSVATTVLSSTSWRPINGRYRPHLTLAVRPQQKVSTASVTERGPAGKTTSVSWNTARTDLVQDSESTLYSLST